MAALGTSTATIIYAALPGAAIVNTFFRHYWTLAYLRLRGRVAPA